MPEPYAIYLRLPNWIGDVCMSLPSLACVLATGHPVVVCARPWARDFLAAYALAGFIPMSGAWRSDRAHVQTYKKKARHARPRGLLLPDSLSSALVFRFAGIACAGHRDDGRSLILRWPLAKAKDPMHAVQTWHRLTVQSLRRWGLARGVPPLAPSLDWQFCQKHDTHARRLIETAHLASGEFVLIAPTAVGEHRGQNKVWPYFDALTRELQSQGQTVVMCPPPSEVEQALRAAPTAQRLPSTDLGSFARLTRHAKLVICNDSGVSHLAAAAGAKQLTLFGVTERFRTGPWSTSASCLGSSKGWPDLAEVLSRIRVMMSE